MPDNESGRQRPARIESANGELNKTPAAVSRNMAAVWALWAYLAILVLVMGGFAVHELVRGNLIGAFIDLAGMTYLAWAFAGAFIAIPLSLFVMDYGKSHPSEIEKPYRKALILWNKLHLRKDITYAGLLNTVAFLRQSQGDFDASAQKYEEATKILERSKRGAYPHLAVALNNLGALYLKQKNLENAEQKIDASLVIWERQKAPEWCGSAIPLSNKGVLRMRQRRLEESEDLLLQAKRRFESNAQPGMIVPSTMKQSRISCFLGLALVYAKQGRKGDLRQAAEQMLLLYKTSAITTSPIGLDVLMELAEHCLELGENDLACRIIQQGYEIGRQRSDYPDCERVLELYEKILLDEGRSLEIEDMKRWLLPGPRETGETSL